MELEEPQHDKSGLHFNEPLSWRAGRPIAIADLLRRLQALAKELSGMEQEENDRETFLNVAKELASPNLLGHKDKGVKAWTACCLVDILKLCAPDAPYTGQQLKVSRYVRKPMWLRITDGYSGCLQHAHCFHLSSFG